MTLVVLDLGTNIDREASLANAMEQLSEHFTLLRSSSVYKTVPVGMSSQPDFYNLALEVETDKSITEVRDIAIAIEDKMGRNRSGPKFGPRNIDIDIVLYGDVVDAKLAVPHPQTLTELFVVSPLAQLHPEGHHPETKQSWKDLRGKLMAGRSGKDAGIEKQSEVDALPLGEQARKVFGSASAANS